MPDRRIENLNIASEDPLMTPNQLKRQFPLTETVIQTVMTGQSTIKNIIDGKDPRIFVVVGPCSIHDPGAAREYAMRLRALADEVKDSIYLIMRVYFEKPRTTTGWQGLINDPFLDKSGDIESGLKIARSLLLDIAQMDLPAAGEALDIVTPQYVQDLFSWTAIGARTTESQTHRKMASGFSTAVGFKNGTNGDLDIAINALSSAAVGHNFISVDPNGDVAVIRTKGNPYTHIILRGGRKPNYDSEHVIACEKRLIQNGHQPVIMIDCSHANSGKNPNNQEIVLENVGDQIVNGNLSVRGLMLESHLNEGKQSISGKPETLKYGVSVTDACIDWDTTARIIKKFNERIKPCIEKRFKSISLL
jgi:3-deoxy-7-phosphoheptulonate synthase